MINVINIRRIRRKLLTNLSPTINLLPQTAITDSERTRRAIWYKFFLRARRSPICTLIDIAFSCLPRLEKKLLRIDLTCWLIFLADNFCPRPCNNVLPRVCLICRYHKQTARTVRTSFYPRISGNFRAAQPALTTATTSRKNDQEHGNTCTLAFDNFIYLSRDPSAWRIYTRPTASYL